MNHNDIEYEHLIEDALRGVIRDCLTLVVHQGLPGAHHFYITFLTHYPGVVIPEFMRAQYPQEMTIVLQNRFWDLKVNQQAFSVGLSFSGINETIVIPFAAIVGFADPSVNFGLRFETHLDEEAEEEIPETKKSKTKTTRKNAKSTARVADNKNTSKKTTPPSSSSNVIYLDAYRKN